MMLFDEAIDIVHHLHPFSNVTDYTVWSDTHGLLIIYIYGHVSRIFTIPGRGFGFVEKSVGVTRETEYY